MDDKNIKLVIQTVLVGLMKKGKGVTVIKSV